MNGRKKWFVSNVGISVYSCITLLIFKRPDHQIPKLRNRLKYENHTLLFFFFFLKEKTVHFLIMIYIALLQQHQPQNNNQKQKVAHIFEYKKFIHIISKIEEFATFLNDNIR